MYTRIFNRMAFAACAILLPAALILVSPASAPDESVRPPLSSTMFQGLAMRIEALYPLPIDTVAIRATMTAQGREFAEGDVQQFDRCNRLAPRDERQPSFLDATFLPADCAVENRSDAERARIMRIMAELLLEQLQGKNNLVDLNQDGQILPSASEPETVGFSIDWRGEVLFLRLGEIGQGTTSELVTAASATAAAIVLDLRGNEGGLLDEVVGIADAFLGEGEIARTEANSPRNQARYIADSDEIAQGIPMVVLVDFQSASGAEIIAAALQDNGRAMVIGAPTMGEATIRTLLPVSRGLAVILVTEIVRRPAGQLISGQGVTPDCLIDPSADGFLDQAAAIAAGLASCPTPIIEDSDRLEGVE